jgi:hypothetical protein
MDFSIPAQGGSDRAANIAGSRANFALPNRGYSINQQLEEGRVVG